MKVILVKAGLTPEVIDLVEHEDKYRQIAARMSCSPNNLKIEKCELDEMNVALLKAPESEGAIVSGINYYNSKPYIYGDYVICHYNDSTGLLQELRDSEINKIMGGIIGNVICTFNAAKIRANERKAEQKRLEKSTTYKKEEIRFFVETIRSLCPSYVQKYLSGDRVYQDILRDNPTLAEIVRKYPDELPYYAVVLKKVEENVSKK